MDGSKQGYKNGLMNRWKRERERQIFRCDDEWVVRWRQGEREIGKDSFIDGLMEG